MCTELIGLDLRVTSEMESWAFPVPSYLAFLLCLSTRSFPCLQASVPRPLSPLPLPVKTIPWFLSSPRLSSRLVLIYHFLLSSNSGGGPSYQLCSVFIPSESLVLWGRGQSSFPAPAQLLHLSRGGSRPSEQVKASLLRPGCREPFLAHDRVWAFDHARP